MKPLNHLLIIFILPPFAALVLGIAFLIVTWPSADHPDPRPTGTIGVKKGGRIGSAGDMPAPP